MHHSSTRPTAPTLALGVIAAVWVVVVVMYLRHGIVLTSDSMNNYVHVWYVAGDIWHHARLPWRMPVLGHGEAFAYPYGFVNWTTCALLWPLFGNWTVTLWTVLGVGGCVVATYFAFPELRHGWWASAVLVNPAINQALFFGQQTFAWSAALLLAGIGCWRRERRLAAALLVGLAQLNHAAVVAPITLIVIACRIPFEIRRKDLLRYYALSAAIAAPAVVIVLTSPIYSDSSTTDKVVNFITTIPPRALVVLLPTLLVAIQCRTAVRSALALALSIGLNGALAVPLNLANQLGSVGRYPQHHPLDAFTDSPAFRIGATYRVLRGTSDAKFSIYQVLVAGGRSDSELFPEGMAIRSFDSVDAYDRLLCARHIDFVLAFDSYTTSHHTNEQHLLRTLASHPSGAVRVHAIKSGPDYRYYTIDRSGCGAT